ncbi:DUF92 domain-containing protein [Mucilaginibacter auburnensis]|uniref:Uncharacterized protein (TIGR00297 family) n=1 Tax=Mucilaginibacter auburnensis TaxID=1457233 RepID=A0A2H9VSX7_9SPHI|nr:DUF92 domain-containing protein [Mucilaginibacter auburnensis]PJJ83927.1 uncharacterized protein (TIGR00297 family) [Mucilaginibacter auburnensis]
MPITDSIVYLTLLLAGVWSYSSGKLTMAGSITGAVTGLVIFKGAGLSCFLMLTSFFVLGSAATKWKRDKKAVMNATDAHQGRRTAAQVVANSGVAVLLSLYALWKPDELIIIQLMIAGSFAAATADTLSSELGTVYGKRFYNVISFNKETAGLDGVVSLEGTLIGIVGAFIITAVNSFFSGWSNLLCIVIGGFTGNLVDSILGATLERNGLMGNNVVNFLNTVVGAVVCWACNYI